MLPFGSDADKRRIMVVEDSPTQAIRIQYLLEQHGFAAECVYSAEEALETLKTARPDLLMVDFHLPGIQGDELCRRVRMNINTQGVPILMLTMESNATSELHGLDSGADDYVSKTEDPDILVLRINALLRKSMRHGGFFASEESFFRKARVLIIDDSPTYLELLSSELIAEGYSVETAATGRDGIERARSGNFDGAVIDLMLPDDVDGLDICHALSRDSDRAPVVMLMVSVHESKENVMRALEAGADDFIAKSSDLSVLKGRLRALLRHKFLHEQHRTIIQEFEARENDLERMVEERTRELKQEIADRRRAEEEARLAKEQAEAANRAKTEFLANMSHELRTPLNAVIGFSDMIRNKVLGPLSSGRYEEYIENIYESGQHLLEIINDILDVSRIEVGKVKLHEETVGLAKIINAAVRLIREQAGKGRLSLVMAVDALPPVRADERLLKQALLNILSNAVKFTPEHGEILIRAALQPDGRLTVAVRDTGIGISPADIEMVMTPFGQVDSSLARKHTGTGLGLPLSKMFLELHGGDLTIASVPGEGTTVTLVLPAERVEAMADPDRA